MTTKHVPNASGIQNPWDRPGWTERRRRAARANSERLRRKAQHMVGRGKCSRCPERRWYVLHIHHRKPVGSGGRTLATIHLYRAIVTGREDPRKYRLLCANDHEEHTYKHGDVLAASKEAMKRKRARAEIIAWHRSRREAMR